VRTQTTGPDPAAVHKAPHEAPRPDLLDRDDGKFASGKIAFFQYVAVGVLVFLISGFWELQVRHYEDNTERAERNRIKSIPILAPRGKILDRDGRVIVDNHSSFSVILTRENMKPEHLKPIADGLNLDYEDLLHRVKRFSNRPKYEPMMLKQELTPGELAFVESHRDPDTFPELEIIHSQRRLYPRDGFAAHAIGYVGEVSESELNTAEFAKYGQGDIIGKTGLERQYNDQLMGIDGQRQVVVDNLGREREVMGKKEAQPGRTLQLTLDLDLQAVAELSMESKRGAVIALDPRSGEVLAMVSRPAYDLNTFAGRVSNAEYRELVNNPDKPFMNRAIQAQLAPGSTFKPIMMLAALESGIDPKDTVSCAGGAYYYGRRFGCHLKSGHGVVNMHRAIIQSCDTYFYSIGNRMGIDKIAEYAQMAGAGKRTGIDLPAEAEGVMPSTRWKLRTQREKWYAGETISVAIGQGAVQMSPLQLAYAIGGIVNGGSWRRPHLVKEARGDRPREFVFDPESIRLVKYGMFGVVNEGGTGARARLPGIPVGGKTGTAQLVSKELIKAQKITHIKDNAWFVGFAPQENPEIVVVALFEAGEHGNLAAPIVRDVIKAHFDKKARAAQDERTRARMALLSPPGGAR
jgi:penicillin-binding protein 2